MAWDTYSGTVTLPDGRQVKAIFRGRRVPAPDYWEDAPKDALTIEWLDGEELTADEYNIHFKIEGMPFGSYLHEFVAAWLVAKGDFEYGYDEPPEYE